MRGGSTAETAHQTQSLCNEAYLETTTLIRGKRALQTRNAVEGKLVGV